VAGNPASLGIIIVLVVPSFMLAQVEIDKLFMVINTVRNDKHMLAVLWAFGGVACVLGRPFVSLITSSSVLPHVPEF
jgi:hypothetical protein